MPRPALREHGWPAIAVVILGALAYSNSLGGPFVFDDLDIIGERTVLRHLGNYWFWPTAPGYSSNRYVADFTFALNYAAGGFEVTGYHLVNLLIHLGNALLVYALVSLLLTTPRVGEDVLVRSRRLIAGLTAGLFVAHPIQTQAVTYVVQRYTSLATTFYLLAFVLFAAWRLQPDTTRRSSRWALYAAALASALLAMKTKEISFTLPFALILLEGLFFSGRAWPRARALLPFLAAALVVPLTWLALPSGVAGLVGDVARASRVDSLLSRSDYLLTEIAVIAVYVRLLLLPIGQNLDYDFPVQTSLLSARVVAGALLIVAMTAAAGLAARRSSRPGLRLVAFGIAWFFVALSVESSLIPISDVMFEHRLYLPSVGFFTAIAAGVCTGVERRWPKRGWLTVTAFGALIAVALGVATFERNRVWADPVTLWSDVVAKSPSKHRPRLNYGKALFDKGEVDASIEQYLRAIALNPLYDEAYNNLGVSLYRKGRVDEAIDHLRRAIALNPGYAEAHNNLGVAYGKKGWFDLARQEIALGMRLNAALTP